MSVFWLKFEKKRKKEIALFEISTLKFFNMPSFMQKKLILYIRFEISADM